MELDTIRVMYSFATSTRRERANETASKWSEESAIQSFREYIDNFNDLRIVRFDRLPDFAMADMKNIANLNSFDGFFRVGKNRYLIEVKCKLFDSNYTLKTKQISAYKKIIEDNDELQDFVFLFKSLFGHNDVYHCRLSELIGVDFEKETYSVPSEILELIDEDYRSSSFDQEITRSKFIKNIGAKGVF